MVWLRTALFVLLAALLLAAGLYWLVKRPSPVKSQGDKTFELIDPDKLREQVKTLSEDFLPRDGKHPQNLLAAAEHIAALWRSYGVEVQFQDYHFQDKRYRNVIAELGPNTEPLLVIGAHYDAYGPHPGADDNASGVVGLSEVLRLLSQIKLARRVIVVAYTLEETPYFADPPMGSFQHAQSLQGRDVGLMIALEMIGYFSEQPHSQAFPLPLLKWLYPTQGNYIAVVDRLWGHSASELKVAINRYTDLAAYSINAPRQLKGIDFSDHRSYWQRGWPAVMVTDTAFYRNHHYHRASDTYQTLNYRKMAQVVYGVFKYIEAWAGVAPAPN